MKIKYKDLWHQPRGKVGLKLSKMWLVPLVALIIAGYCKEGLLPHIINCFGIETKAVVTSVPTVGGRSSHRLGYVFHAKGRYYHGGNAVYIEDIHLGDTLTVQYLRACPRINISNYDLEIRTLSF